MGRIQYRRQKQEPPGYYDIKRLTPQLSSIMDCYLIGQGQNDFNFSIVKRKEMQDQFKDVQWERKRHLLTNGLQKR